jgi:hypothetical protein
MRGTSRALLTIALGAMLIARPAAAQETSPGEEFGLAVGAAAANIFYTPAKVVVALGGLVLGAFTGVFTGGDVRAAYAVWVPAAGGTYLLRPSHLDGTELIEFFGSDYADTPSTAVGPETGVLYDAQYSM